MTTIDRVIADVTYVERLIERHTELQATRHYVFSDGRRVKVEVLGALHEARAWRAAVDGRIFPSSVDRHGIRRQVVIGHLGIEVQVVEYPAAVAS